MKAMEIISRLPHKTFKSEAAYYARNKRVIARAGYHPIKATFDSAGNCVVCGESGRCPGWHTEDEKPQS